ncbi:MAG: hypothetical protein AAGD33_21240, partial [Actinomycetota bacterium]
GDAVVLDMPDAEDGFVEYYRSISGEHPDWDEYRQAMADQDKCLILITPSRWGPLATGGFPPQLFEDRSSFSASDHGGGRSPSRRRACGGWRRR